MIIDKALKQTWIYGKMDVSDTTDTVTAVPDSQADFLRLYTL